MAILEIIGTPLYQWEVGRKVRVNQIRGVSIDSVNFSHHGDAEALVVKPKEENGVIVAEIPNILLQDEQDIVAHAVTIAPDKREMIQESDFPVRKRARPSTYVYTETEVLNYASLDKRIDNLEGEGLSKAVADYLKENPVEAGATKEQAQQIEQNKQNIETLSTNKLDSSKLPEAVNTALAQAKESGLFDGKDGLDGRDGVDGKDGSNGRDGVDGAPGKNGADGQPGKDGTSPVVSVSSISGGHRITITDKNGTNTVDVMNGKNGSDGAAGSPGKDGSNGKDGVDGYTPVKGKDYFTEAEKTEMVNAVKAALPVYSGEVVAV